MTHIEVLNWAEGYSKVNLKNLEITCLKDIKDAFISDLKNYFSLAALARSGSAQKELSDKAHTLLFSVRVKLERNIDYLLQDNLSKGFDLHDVFFKNSFFGSSKKQGVSLRMPLSSCTPSSLCAGGCYAHDVLDASPFAMIRGVVNGCIAFLFEKGNANDRKSILDKLRPHTLKAVKNARKELKDLPSGFRRRPYIRFSHVGEVANYPNFANALAMQVRSLSRKGVDCVIYTRHSKARELNPELWIMNFSLDPSSLNRVKWIPKQARIVYSAFGGITSSLAEVNFLEHHRHQHLAQTEGDGKICPATKPETIERTCDACRCNTCFVKPNN